MVGDDARMKAHKPATLMLAAGVLLGGCGPDDRSFDAAAWQGEGKERNQAFYQRRARMVDALREEVLQPGMTRDEVRELLGAPDGDRHNTFYYEIGGMIDMNYLAVAFDEQGLLRSISTTQG